MKSLMPAVVRQYEERGYYAPAPSASRQGAYAHILVGETGRIDDQRARERGRQWVREKRQ